MSHLNQSKTLESLSNVNITNAINNDILQYDSTTNTWKNKILTGGVSNLNDLTDVTLTSPTNNQILQYNGSQWVNSIDIISNNSWVPTLSNLVNLANTPTITAAQFTKIGNMVNGVFYLDNVNVVLLSTPTSYDFDLPFSAISATINQYIGITVTISTTIASSVTKVTCISNTHAQHIFSSTVSTGPFSFSVPFSYIAQ